jgi:hypothetical protein
MPRPRRVDHSMTTKTRTATSPPPRKRDRYVLHACNRCKAAKVRCNGELPCAYCVVRNPDTCYYSTPRLPYLLTESARDRALQSG